MKAIRIPFGMDRLPRALSPDDPRLPGVTVGAVPLRLNTEPLPPEAMTPAPDHAARVAAMRAHLHAQCGDYAPHRQLFIDTYFAALAAHLDAHRATLAQALQRFDGLFAPDDWLWSAPRPLPRAWLRGDTGPMLAEIAFWDGVQAVAVDFGSGPMAPGVARCAIDPAMLRDPVALLAALPAMCRDFWAGETLPRSPFRRPIPDGVLETNE